MAESSPTLLARCACGAKIRVPIQHAGKKARCRKCGGVVKIPASDAAARAPRRRPVSARDGATPSQQPSSGKIHVHCDCGAHIGMPASAAGRKARCPKCATTIHIPRLNSLGISPDRPTVNTSPERDGQTVVSTPAGSGGDPSIEETALDDLMSLGEGEEVDSLDPQPITDDDLYTFSEQPFIAPEEPKTSRYVPKPKGPSLTCPSCNTQLGPGAKICVACGIDAKTGKAPLMVEDEHLDQTYIRAERTISAISWVCFYGVYPVASEAFGTRIPWTIRIVGLACVIFSLWGFQAIIYSPDPTAEAQNKMLWPNELIDTAANRGVEAVDPNSGGTQTTLTSDIKRHAAKLQQQGIGYHDYQLFTHQFLHGGPVHLIVNMLFLFVLGSRVNALIGNLMTILIYPFLGVIAGLIHLQMSDDLIPIPMIGASGAIMGMSGMYLVLFPVHKVHVAAWWRWGFYRGFHLSMNIFDIRGFWVVLFYIAFDILYVLIRLDDGVAHWAHLGGFIGGVVIAFGLLVARMINARGGDILSMTLGKYAWPLIGKPTAWRMSLP